MTIVCVDDDRAALEKTVSMCRELPQTDDARGFDNPGEALEWIREHPADAALLDIHMPGTDGLALATQIRRARPETAILFLTAHPEHALRAFEIHAEGYMLKPADPERLAAEIDYAAGRKHPRETHRVEARTFGNFDLFADGEIVRFRQAKCKELLAYLIDRQGGDVSRAEAFAALWQDRDYDRPMQKQFDVIIRALRETLAEHGADAMFEMSHARMRVRPEHFSCDFYRFLDGDRAAISAYQGEYMNNYSWATNTEGFLTMRQMNGDPDA